VLFLLALLVLRHRCEFLKRNLSDLAVEREKTKRLVVPDCEGGVNFNGKVEFDKNFCNRRRGIFMIIVADTLAVFYLAKDLKILVGFG
jgi:hypothetical protein